MPTKKRESRKNEEQKCSLLLCFLCLFAAKTLLAKPADERREVQSHGVWFEKWVRDTFFEGYQAPSYTQKWDIPARFNTHHGGVAVNPKAAKYKTPVDMGDALRQFQINEPFLLVIGYWRQDGKYKRLVNIVAPRVEVQTWRKLWGEVTLADLQRLDSVVKDASLSVAQARQRAREIKNAPPFTTCAFTLNPKIDAHQRRLQCSLRFAIVFDKLAPTSGHAVLEHPQLWGVYAPPPLFSPPRAFSHKIGT